MAQAPFTVGCFGPVHDVDECRELYAGACDRVLYHVETDYGEGDYGARALALAVQVLRGYSEQYSGF